MDWQDEAVVLSVRQYGENARIATLLTEEHGRHAGLVRGSGAGRGGSIQTGQIVRAGRRARLSEHLGNWQIEPLSHPRSEEHTSELQSLMRISYGALCLKKNKNEQIE